MMPHESMPVNRRNKLLELLKSNMEELRRCTARTRDKPIHSDFGVDIDILWDICMNDISDLEKHLTDVLEKER